MNLRGTMGLLHRKGAQLLSVLSQHERGGSRCSCEMQSAEIGTITASASKMVSTKVDPRLINPSYYYMGVALQK